jgi:hypothetical protein
MGDTAAKCLEFVGRNRSRWELCFNGVAGCGKRHNSFESDTRDAMSSTSCLAVVVGMFLRGMFVVFNGMQMMPMRNLGVMRCLFMIARFMMFCRLAMVLGGLLMMVCRLLMVLVDCVLRPCSLPDSLLVCRSKHRRGR